ncbi:MAG: T9SS type A sorting domain-containing protein [Sphingobacteriales bacterium JAD_PAG50586_3]|nr:MAG: T9SS type A sorting domain-containing protein [Sphingobacteriales bacterium JAD_PAG50586_3]
MIAYLKQIAFGLLLLIWANATAQHFAPAPSSWTYKCKSVFEEDTMIFDKTITCYPTNVVYDSVINRTVTKIVDGSKIIYLYESMGGDTIFWRSPQGTYSILYNFNAAPGDTWVTPTYYTSLPFVDTITVYVDSTGYEVINNDTLRVLFIRNKYPSAYGFGLTPDNMDVIKVYDKLGAETFLFPQYYLPENIAIPRKLICYSDCAQIGFWNAPDERPCNPFLTIIKETNKSPVLIYPNPTLGSFMVKPPFNDVVIIHIYDMQGRLVETKQVQPDGLLFSQYPSGLYTVCINHKGIIYSQKLVVE